MRSPLTLAAGLCAALACTRSNIPTPAGEAVALHPSAVAQIEALLAEKEARSPAQRKISSQLLYAKNGLPAGLGAAKPAPLESTSKPDASGRVLVDLKGDVTPELLGLIETLGGKVVLASPAHRSVRAWMRLDELEALAAEPAVQAIRPALEASTWRADPPRGGAKFRARSRQERVEAMQQAVRQSLSAPRPALLAGGVASSALVVSEGGRALGADRAIKFFAADGTGVRIGVLSDSDDFKEESIASGELPADTVTVPGQDGRPGTGEGTAIMQIAHDLAPGAQLFFATAFNGPESFADNIRSLRFTYGCDVIVDDIIYFFESPYEDDIIAQAVDDVTADGAVYVSSAGNCGNLDDGTSGTWEGDFRSGGALAALPSGYTVHDFGAGVISNRVERLGGPLFLHWSDPGTLDAPASSNDYDLFLLDQDLRNVVLASTDIQDGTGLPFEYLGFFIPPNFRVVVARKSTAAARAVRVMLFEGELALATAGSTYGHNSAAGAIGVTAVDVAEAGGGEFSSGPTTPVELFGSDGYRRVFYDRNNQPLRGGVTFGSEGGQLRRKPDLAAADGVRTSLSAFLGFDPFFGTSAAAPHAAAVAAMVKSALPGASAARIRRALASSALDIEAAGADRDSGAGLVSAFGALSQAGASPAVFLELLGTTATATGGDAILPGGGGEISVEIANDGGAAATGITASLTSTSPDVTVTQPSSAYPDVAPGGTASNAAAFTFSLAPSAPCGERLGFSLSVSFTGHGKSPAVFDFAVHTGRPAAGPPATFAYAGPPAAIPDDDLAGVDVPLTVEAAGPASKVVFRFDGDACASADGATTVGLDHTWVGDLAAKLTSPSGTTVPLMSRPGTAFNSGNNFCHTALDDGAAGSIQNIISVGNPWMGTFAPASPLAAFSGEIADGTWVLNVSDVARFDTGSVRAFSLDLTGFDCTP